MSLCGLRNQSYTFITLVTTGAAWSDGHPPRYYGVRATQSTIRTTYGIRLLLVRRVGLLTDLLIYDLELGLLHINETHAR